MNKPEKPGKMDNSFLPWKFLPWKISRMYFQACCFFPVFVFKYIAGGNSSKGIGIFKIHRVYLMNSFKIITLFFCKIIFSFLQVSINKIVYAMKLLRPMTFNSCTFGI